MPMVCACLMVACDVLIPAAFRSKSNSSAVKTDPLLLRMCVGTCACLVNTDSNALTNDTISSRLRDAAKMYLGKSL